MTTKYHMATNKIYLCLLYRIFIRDRDEQGEEKKNNTFFHIFGVNLEASGDGGNGSYEINSFTDEISYTVIKNYNCLLFKNLV